MRQTDDNPREFSRIFHLDELEKDEVRFDLSATGDERAALATRFGLPAIERLHAAGSLKRLGSGRVRLRARLSARVTQTCVVTLDPLENEVQEDLDIMFEPADDGGESPDIDYDPESDCEPLTGDSLDVGEIVAEELALALDPYPRKPGFSLEIDPNEKGGKTDEGGPFEALAVLKRKD